MDVIIPLSRAGGNDNHRQLSGQTEWRFEGHCRKESSDAPAISHDVVVDFIWCNFVSKVVAKINLGLGGAHCISGVPLAGSA